MRLGILMVLAIAAVGCSSPKPDVQLRLPKSIGGVDIAYFRSDPEDVAAMSPDDTPRQIAAALGVPPNRVTFVTGVRDIQRTYESTLIQVRGVRSADLLEATLKTYRFIGARRTDTIAGKSIIRAVTEDAPAIGGDIDLDHAPYFYVLDDVVVILLGRPDYVEEAIRALP